MSFDVYGLGNALVDIQYQVDPSFFKEMGIDKGVMSIDEICATLEQEIKDKA